jgi:hypothetical protein
LPVQLKSAVVERALQVHVAEHRPKLIVTEAVPFERRRLNRFGHPDLPSVQPSGIGTSGAVFLSLYEKRPAQPPERENEPTLL